MVECHLFMSHHLRGIQAQCSTLYFLKKLRKLSLQGVIDPSHFTLLSSRNGWHDNQWLAAKHDALKQQIEDAQHELQLTHHFARNLLMDNDMQMRELYEKSAKMEHDLRGVKGMRAELMQLHADIRELTATNQKPAAQVLAMTQDLSELMLTCS
ncbi:hypothetical protein R6Q59_026437 [Mikania micrantha]